MDRSHIALLLIFVTSTANAEVSDKIASIPNMWIVAFFVGVIASILTIWKKLFFFLGVAFSALFFSATFDSSSDQNLATAITTEQGQQYFVHAYITSLIPLAMVCFTLLYARKRRA
ncbi:hypothetical protein ACE0DR_17065 [Azotobacter sp. CWF10]